MDAFDHLSDIGRVRDRRALPSILNSIEAVRSTIIALRDKSETSAEDVDWHRTLLSLDRLSNAIGAVPDDVAPTSSSFNPRGLSGSSGQKFVAIAGIDRFSILREELGESLASLVTDEVCARIKGFSGDVQLGRLNRSTIEFTFYADNFDLAIEALARLQRQLELPIAAIDGSFCLDVTIGVADRNGEGDVLESAIDCAEQALAKARASHAKVSAFTDQDRILRARRLALMRDLRVAPSRSELFVCYQPKLSVRTCAIASVESLVRWRHPELGIVPPDDFISLAEESDEIRPLTEFVLKQALADQVELKAAGASVVIDINISGRLLADESFTAWVLELLDGEPQGIGFEITETAVIANPERALAQIRSFVDAGVRIAIDDYGSGLSSLTYLKQIPAHELKIDKAFVTNLTKSHRDPLLVRSTIELAHALDMEVTAEGVDNARSMALLQAMGCDMVQGYHISKPLRLPDLISFLREATSDTFANRPLVSLSR